MTRLRYKRKLGELQKERTRIEALSRGELATAAGEKRQELTSQWSTEFYTVQEQIDELQSDYLREVAERLDLALPVREEREFWERMHVMGDRLIMTVRGREQTREKMRREKREIREGWGFYFQMLVTLGSLLVAALAIYFRK